MLEKFKETIETLLKTFNTSKSQAELSADEVRYRNIIIQLGKGIICLLDLFIAYPKPIKAIGLFLLIWFVVLPFLWLRPLTSVMLVVTALFVRFLMRHGF